MQSNLFSRSNYVIHVAGGYVPSSPGSYMFAYDMYVLFSVFASFNLHVYFIFSIP